MPLSIKFPIRINSDLNAGLDSHADIETTEAIKQNMKMLLLTMKGEYVWDQNFGVGLGGYLFYNGISIPELFEVEIS